jgi:thiol-disulfide isomerase/thioredoxin
VKRNFAILVGIIICIALLVMSAVLTWRHRQAELAEQPPRVELIPASPAPAGVTNSGAAETSADAPPEDVNLRGKMAKNFTLKDLQGKDVSLKDFRGKPVLLNFWATWCAPCKIEIPWFEKFQEQYAAQGLTILGVTAEDIPQAEVEKSAKGLGINYTVLLRGDTVANDWGGLDGLPTSFFIDRDGKIVDQTIGLYSRDAVEAKIKKILASAPSQATPKGD